MDHNEVSQIKDVLTVASPLIKGIVDKLVIPKIELFTKRLKIDYNKDWVPTAEHFLEYFNRTYKKVSVVNTLVFNNSQKLLKDIYIPLTIRNTGQDRKRTRLTNYPKSILDELEKILITDTAGMGKSTLMKILFLDIIDTNQGIPILIELRRLSKDKTILKEIHEQISPIDKDFDSQLLLELIKDGGFIFILDGYDEISLSDRENVTSDLQSFVGKANKNKFILTSRPEKALSSFGDFEQFTIQPLEKHEAFELLRKYDKHGELSTLLIKKLQEQEMSNIDEFLINPLLVSLLFTAFQHKQAVPFKKYLFYRQVYDANFESHDLTKGDSYSHDKYCKLEIDDFHRVLRHVGFSTFKLQKIEFDKDELLSLIRDSKSFCVGLVFKESDFLNDLLRTVPLFTQDGIYFRWAHKSLQEYFAAQFIYLDAKDHQNSIIMQIYQNDDIDKFQNILDLYYDIDFKVFRNVILYNFLKEYKEFYNSYLVDINEQINHPELQLRKELCFYNQPYLFSIGRYKSQLNHRKLNTMVHEWISNQPSSEHGFNGIFKEEIKTGGIFCFYWENPKFILLSILANKRSPLVKTLKRPVFTKVSQIVNYTFPNEYQLISLTDDPNHSFNSKPNFAYINNLLIYSRIGTITLNTEKALNVLVEIEASIKQESENNFLLFN